MILSWILYLFPSGGQYAKILIPVFMTLVTLLGMLPNILPEPGHIYPVPDVIALETELGTQKGVIVKLALFTRRLTVTINWFIATSLYTGFYKTSLFVISKIPLVKKNK
jgi:hypothetical protein